MISRALPAEGQGLQCSNVVEGRIPYGLNIPKMAIIIRSVTSDL
jgi:hypothetical protein